MDKADVLLISAMILETNRGTQYIYYIEEFLDKLIRDPQNVLKIDISFERFAQIINPKARNFTKNQDTIKRISDKINDRIKRKLAPLNYFHIIQNDQKREIISLGPSSFRFIALFRERNEKERKS